MRLSRRELMLAAGGLSLCRAAAGAAPDSVATGATLLPDKSSFLDSGLAYLDSGSQHPLSIGGRAAVEAYLAKRMLDPAAMGYALPDAAVREKFARLVNADADEIAYVQSTMSAEQMILRGLGLPASRGHIVTDTLHFFGSLPLYEEMARQGARVSWVRERDGRIPLEELRRAVQPGTRLVALSLVSTVNGFQHDLKAVCDIAHAHGALVYADIIHAAGCVPVDVRASGVDFAACATYKWLMGEFGLGFVYARKDVQPLLRRTECGYYGLKDFTTHVYPLDPPGRTIADYSFEPTAEGRFAHSTHAHTVIAQLDHSLDYIQRLGVARIQAHAQSLIERLKRELPQRGYPLMTPLESTTPIVSCVLANARERLEAKLAAARVRITLRRNHFASPSVFNDHQDLDRLLEVLGHA
ncbi:MAG: aminotransferase class V-fold PLP-dependent enzyme [Steroidobacteraceae bacterium]